MSLYSTPRFNGVRLGPYEDDGTVNTNHGGYIDFLYKGSEHNGYSRIIHWPVGGNPGLNFETDNFYINGLEITSMIRRNVALVLWSNASESAFPGQTITVNYYDCNYILVLGKVGENASGNDTHMISGLVPVIVGARGYLSTFGIDFWLHARQFTVRQNAIEFTSGFMRDPDGTIYENWDGRSVPMKVLGFRF